MSDAVKARLEFLRREIDRHDRLYYVDAKPVIGDRDYDLLYEELLTLEREHPEFVTEKKPRMSLRGGISCIMVNTEKAREFMPLLEERMIVHPVSLESVSCWLR